MAGVVIGGLDCAFDPSRIELFAKRVEIADVLFVVQQSAKD